MKREKLQVVEDNKLKQFMIGSMLGDGCIPKHRGSKNCNHHLSFGHCEKQLPYLQWKASILDKYNLSTGSIHKQVHISDRYKSGSCTTYSIHSRANPYFKKYRDLFYPQGKKLVSEIVKEIDVLGLAIWFMDDGYLVHDKIRPRFIYKISTDGFSPTDLQLLIKVMKENFNLTFTVNYSKELRLSTKDNDKFVNLIEPHILGNFKYKLHKYRVLSKEEELQER